MKRLLISLAVTLTIGCGCLAFLNDVMAEGDRRPSGIPSIDSSTWAANPEKYGMTAKDYIQGETRAFFANFINRSGLNKFFHFQGLSKAEDKWVVSPNNDTIYSIAVVNVKDGFKLVLPDVGERFLSVHIIDENHISPFYLYGGGEREFKANQFATDFVGIGVRTGTDGTAKDVKYVLEQLHTSYMIIGANPNDVMARPDIGRVEKVRAALIAEYSKLPDTFGTMQSRTEDVKDWEKFAYVTAGAWGLSKEENAMYLPYAKSGVKGGTCYTATYKKVPAEAFFSITVYGPDKYLMANENNIVSTSRGLKTNADGSFTVVFGGDECEGKAPNFLYTPTDGWSFLMRAYRPDVEKFRGYELPEIVPVE